MAFFASPKLGEVICCPVIWDLMGSLLFRFQLLYLHNNLLLWGHTSTITELQRLEVNWFNNKWIFRKYNELHGIMAMGLQLRSNEYIYIYIYICYIILIKWRFNELSGNIPPKICQLEQNQWNSVNIQPQVQPTH